MPHVAVVGGGIVGLATAYFLRGREIDVTVLEKNSIGAGNTERALGGIRGQFSSPANVRLSLAAFEVWEQFEERFGVDIGYDRHGYLFLTDDDRTADSFEATVRMQNDLGLPSELLEPEEATNYAPRLRPDAFSAATYSPTDGSADPHLALQGFYQGARERDAQIELDTTVTDIDRLDNGAYRLETDTKSYEADWVVNAAGAWGGRIGELAGLDLPIEPKRRRIAVVEPERPVEASNPLVADLDTGVFFSPDTEGDALVGGHLGGDDPLQDPDRFPTGFEIDWVVDVLERLEPICDHFGPETRIRNGWAGLYAMTPDRSPIIDETRPGFINAIGFSGHGFQHAPAVGQVVADVIRTGDTELTDLGAFRADRFDELDGAERNVL